VDGGVDGGVGEWLVLPRSCRVKGCMPWSYLPIPSGTRRLNADYRTLPF
jgi:hypothetical protein